MVRSTSSCFKIITCSGSDAVNDDGFERIENKSSSMKRGWSFRKKSDRHRNTVILEDSSGGNREHSEAATIDFQGYTSPTIFEKLSPSKTDVVTPMASEANSKAPDPLLLTENSRKIDPINSTEGLDEIGSPGIMKDASKVDPEMEESFAIVIQAAIRGYLSQKALLKIKNVVKLQAAVRGHLVRSQAVGTLRCVQAITKMQALVRARRARILLEGSAVNVEEADGFGRNEQNTTPVGKEVKANPNFYSSEKILRNAFARQLLDSTPKKRPIHIKCDPLRPDSAWIWLERWMSASSPDQHQKTQISDEQERLVDTASCGLQTIAPSEDVSETTGLKNDLRQTTESDGEDSSIEDADKFDIQFLKPATSKDSECQQPPFDGVGEAEDTNSRTQTNETDLLVNLASGSVLNSIPSEPGADGEQQKHASKRIASEQPETEGKKIVIGSRKASNPAFVAAQSKFEELSSTISPSMSFGSTSKGIATESRSDGGLLYPADSQTKTTEMTMSEDSLSHNPRIHAGGLDIGTKVFRSSTLDSPGRSEVTGGEKAGESKVMEEEVSDLNGTSSYPPSLEHPDVGNPVQVHSETLEVVNAVDSVVDRDSQQPEQSASDVQIQHELPMDQPGYRSSPEGSLRSHVTVPESYGTPSSQVSVKAKRKDSSNHAQSRKSKSADKRSPSNPNHDSGTRNSTEKLLKNGKRRNSFGSKTDNADEEPRESNSSTLPSYMQATESARAKAQANNSPRSSPDVQDSEIYLKKRHSLPSAGAKQGSPRVLSSSPQAQVIAKGDQAHSSRGRWQR